MNTRAPDAYLRNAVLTASPEQLQLMLYDGAIRYTRQGRDAIEANDHEAGFNGLSRAQRIVLELQNGMHREANPALCDQMAQLYTFIYRRLVDASINHDTDAADECIRLLEYQRETWALLIQKLAEEQTSPSDHTEPHHSDGGILSVEG